MMREHEGKLELDQSLAQLYDRGMKRSAADYLVALDALWALRNNTSAMFEDYDVLMTPTAAAMPWDASEPYPRFIGDWEAAPRDHAVYTGFANVLGLPAISIPAARSPTSGLPIGFQLVAPFGEDEELLAMANEYESAFPWASDWPPMN
jgi:aspartyl-tRNA(Asn)/glutamyl-tRNA(Gln) amidotransferase subunit A